MFDLSQFEKLQVFAPDNQIGIVLSLPLTAVIEDPTQPRTEFDEDELFKLAEDIGRRGVQAPIAVRPPVDGIYRIIHGARRFRASMKAGLKAIPAIVQEDEGAFDDYSQVLENTQRDSLSPMDIARFIQKRKALGDSNSEIARNLSEKPEWVTYHLALIDLPKDIQKAFDDGQVKGAKTTYELRKLHGKHPEKAKKLVDSGQEITQVRIREVKSFPKIELTEKHEMTNPDVISTAAQSTAIASKTNDVQPRNEVSLSPESLTSPRVIGIYQRNQVQVLVHLRPTEQGFVWIHVPGTSGQQEVLADQITLSRIEEKHP